MCKITLLNVRAFPHPLSLSGKQCPKIREHSLLIHLNMSCSIRTELFGKSRPCEIRAFLLLFLAYMFQYSHRGYRWDQQLERLIPSAGDGRTGPKGGCERGTGFLIAS